MPDTSSNSMPKLLPWKKHKNLFYREISTEGLSDREKARLSSINFRGVSLLSYPERQILIIHKIQGNKVDIDNMVTKYFNMDLDVLKIKASVLARVEGYDMESV